MRIDTRDLRRQYESMSSEALLALDPADLTEAARTVYLEELGRRGLNRDGEAEFPDEFEDEEHLGDDIGDLEEDLDHEGGPDPEWLENAVCVCAFPTGSHYRPRAEQARTALRAAGIACRFTTGLDELGAGDLPPQSLLRLMVPPGLYLHATSILDRDIFNEDNDAEWRTHLAALSDRELRELDPDVFCAGLMDRIARIRKAYEDEMAQRRLARPRR